MQAGMSFHDFNAATAAASAGYNMDAYGNLAVPGIPGAISQAMPGTPAFDMAAAAAMTSFPGFDMSAWAGIAFPTFTAPPAVMPTDLGVSSSSGSRNDREDRDRGDKVDRSKAPVPPMGGDIIRLRGLPWSAGPQEIAAFLHEFGITEKMVTMCTSESGRQDGHAWVVFNDKNVAARAMKDKQKGTIGGRYIELFPWRDHNQKPPVATTTKVFSGILKHFDANRKAGFIFCQEAESDVGNQDIYAYKDVLERGRASVGDVLAFPLHWSPKGQPQASSPLIRIACANGGFANSGIFSILEMGGARGSGIIESPEIKAVFGKGVYVSPALASSLVPGALVAFNCYLQNMPGAFARPPLDGPNVPIASSAIMVNETFVSPESSLNDTATAPGFEHTIPVKGMGKGGPPMNMGMGMGGMGGMY
mmetsp:Transcript_66919/g.120470  ORF Transcript_66919/g.120470 Transcript_66919/m.120470 type:complete len:419 (-) Transcript_66919:173-1429(-)